MPRHFLLCDERKANASGGRFAVAGLMPSAHFWRKPVREGWGTHRASLARKADTSVAGRKVSGIGCPTP